MEGVTPEAQIIQHPASGKMDGAGKIQTNGTLFGNGFYCRLKCTHVHTHIPTSDDFYLSVSTINIIKTTMLIKVCKKIK